MRCAVIDIAIVVVESEGVNRDARGYRCAGMQEYRVDGQIGDYISIIARIRDRQRIAGVPDAPRQQLSAVMDSAVAWILNSIVSVAQRSIAVAGKSIGQSGIVGY